MSFLVLTSRELTALWTSFLIASSVAMYSVIIGLVFVFLLNNVRLIGSRFIRSIILIPLFIPPFIHALTWINAIYIGIRWGWFDYTTLSQIRSVPGVIAVLTVSFFPLSYLILNNAMQQVPSQLKESVQLVTRPTKGFLTIILPLLKQSVLSVFMLIFILSFTLFDVPAFFETNVFLTEVFTQFSSRFNTARALYLSLIPFLVVCFAWGIMMFTLKEEPIISRYVSQKKESLTTMPNLGNAVAHVFVYGLVTISIILPLVSILLGSNLFDQSTFQDIGSTLPIVVDTVVLAVVGSLFMLITTLITYLFMYRFRAGRLVLLSLFAIPAMTVAIVFILLFNRPFLNPIYSTPIILVLAYSIRFVPLLSEILYGQVRQLNPQLIEAARLVKHNDLSMLTQIILPLLFPALLLIVLVGGWLIATELPMTMLLQPSGFQTLTSRLFIYLHYGSQELMNTMTILLLMICFVPAILWKVMQPYGKKN